jgi:hypothetical protein
MKGTHRIACWFIAFSFCATPGCVSIQPVPPIFHVDVSNSNVCQPESCPLYDRREVAMQWAERLNPTQLVPSGIHNWANRQVCKCNECKMRFLAWKERKKQEANEPPWPRFHAVPVKPVFEPEADEPLEEPTAYGAFGRPDSL